MSLQYHLKLAPGDVAPYVLLPGYPGRVPLVASLWDESREVASNREYVTSSLAPTAASRSRGRSTGTGCPSTAIAMEELARVGATTFIRIGTCGTFQDRVHTGDMAIFDSAARYDCAPTLDAVRSSSRLVATHEVVAAGRMEAGERLGYPFHVGTTRSADTFYAMHPRPGSSFNDYWQSGVARALRGPEAPERRRGRDGGERHPGARADLGPAGRGVAAVVLDNVLRVSGDSGEFDPQEQFEHGGDEVLQRLGRMGFGDRPHRGRAARCPRNRASAT